MALAAVLPQPAHALPIIGDPFKSGQQTVATATASSVNPPTGGTLLQGEALPNATRLTSTGAHGGAYGRLSRSSAPGGVPAGTYTLTTRVKAPTTTRADLLTNDLMTGSYGVGTVWKTVKSVIHVSSSQQTVGIGSWDRNGLPKTVDVDWLHLAPSAPTMTIRGNRILNANGGVFTPRGVNRAGYTEPQIVDGRRVLPPHQGDQMYVWGINMVRIGLDQEPWLADCAASVDGVNTSYRAAVKSAVRDLTDRGVMVLVSLNGTERGKNTGCDNPPGLLREMADSRSMIYWDSVATAFLDNSYVAYDLFNEPHDISANVWRNGGTVTYGSGLMKKSYTAVGMQAMYNKIRNKGATNLIFVSGKGWAADSKVHLTNPLDGYGIAAATHTYCHECPDDAPVMSPGIETGNPAELRSRFPLAITEAGWRRHWSHKFNRQVINWAEEHSAGWLIFAWLQAGPDDLPDTYSILLTREPLFDAGGAFVRQPAKSGAPVWNEVAPTRMARGYQALPQPE